MSKSKIVFGGDPELHVGIGACVEAYSRVENVQTHVLAQILKINHWSAAIIFNSVQNVRSRNEMIQGLLWQSYGKKFKPYWAKCSVFLFKLSIFRNAVVHWHPHIQIVAGQQTTDYKSENVMGNPMPGKAHRSLTIRDFPLFTADCRYIEAELRDFLRYLQVIPKTEPLLDKYQQPTIRLNQADLQLPQKPKAQKRPPESSPA